MSRQGPDNPDGTPPQEMHDNIVRYNLVMNVGGAGSKNMHGIEVGGSRYVQGNASYNNSVYYNVVINVTHIALRSKTLQLGAGHGLYVFPSLKIVVFAIVLFSCSYV